MTLLAPANNGLNAYVYEEKKLGFTEEFEVKLLICDVNQVTGLFENCKSLSNDPEFLSTSPEAERLFSSPIVF